MGNSFHLNQWFASELEKKWLKKRPSHENLSRLTVIIPTYGRQDFLLRQALYWGNEVGSLIMMDGSPEPMETGLQNLLQKLPEVKYLHVPDNVSARLAVAAGLIRTPYAVLLGDDEFLLKTGVSKAIEKLDQNLSLVACIGQSLEFQPSHDKDSIEYGAGYQHWKYELAQNDARERLLSAMSDYNAATCYAVFRTPAWKRSWGATKPWSSAHAIELQQAFSTHLLGKFSTVDEIYWLRSNENPPVHSKKKHDRSLSFYDWWYSPQFESERADFIEILVGDALSANDMTHSEAVKIIGEAIDSFLRPARLQKTSDSVKFAVIGKLKSWTGKTLRRVIPEDSYFYVSRKFFRFIGKKHRVRFGRLDDALSSGYVSSSAGNGKLLAELAEVEALVSNFYRARRN